MTPAEGRRFAFTLTGAFLVLAGILWWRGHEIPMWVCAGLGGILFLLGVVIPGRLAPVQRAWMGMALAISRFTTPIFMGIVYYLVITPVGLVRRMFGRASLRVDRSADTYWIRRTDGGSRADMHRQF